MWICVKEKVFKYYNPSIAASSLTYSSSSPLEHLLFMLMILKEPMSDGLCMCNIFSFQYKYQM